MWVHDFWDLAKGVATCWDHFPRQRDSVDALLGKCHCQETISMEFNPALFPMLIGAEFLNHEEKK
jgi:hypothetical protein